MDFDGRGGGGDPGFFPGRTLLKPELDVIFAEVENNLPSIDFELSDLSSEDGEGPIFHRLLRTPTKDAEDAESLDDLGDLCDLCDLAGSETRASPPGTLVRPTDTGLIHGGCDSPLVSPHGRDEGPPRPKKNNWMTRDQFCEGEGTQRLLDHSQENREVPELSPKRQQDSRHKKKTVKTDNSSEVVSKFFPKSSGILALDNPQIDDLLGHTDRGGDGFDDTNNSPPNRDTTVENMSLIQKLAEFSITQSGADLKDIDPATGALCQKKPARTSLKQVKTNRNQSVVSQADTQRHKMASCGTNTSDLANLPRVSPAVKATTEQKETVFLDLRGFDKNRAEERQNLEIVQRILHLTGANRASDSGGDDDGDDDDDVMMWREQRRRIKESLQATGTVPPDLGRPSSVPNRKTVQPLPGSRTQAHRLAGHLSPNKASEQGVTVTSRSTATGPMTGRPPACGAVVGEPERQSKLEDAREVRSVREQRRQSRVRLGQRLEALKPTESTRGRQAAGEETPTLFDLEASYEPPPQTLPTDLLDKQVMLLMTINMSSCGQIVQKTGTARTVDTGQGFSASYTSLLTWLLSLVPDDFSFLSEGPSKVTPGPAPFHVLGLQQLCVDGDLGLHVAVAPVESFTARDVPVRARKKKDSTRDTTPFRQILSKYLSVNTLHTVCPWLQDLVSIEISSADETSSTSNQSEPDQTSSSSSHSEPDQTSSTSSQSESDLTSFTTDATSGSPFAYKPPLPSITARPLATYIQVRPDPEAVEKIFGAKVGFFWNTVDTDEARSEQFVSDEGVSYETQNTMSLVYKKVYRKPCSMMGILNRVLQEGLDLCGVRLLYPTPALMTVEAGRVTEPNMEQSFSDPNNYSAEHKLQTLNKVGPILALAIRGTFARTIWLDAVGPSDPVLARRTDPNSLCALYGGDSRGECLLFCPRNPARVLSELCRWFGGRVPPSGVVDVGPPLRKHPHPSGGKKGKKMGCEEGGGDLEALTGQRPPATLVATSNSDIFLVISPLVPARCLGLVLAVAQRRGYQLRGARRTRLHPKRASVLGLSGSQIAVCCQSEAETVPTDFPLTSDPKVVKKGSPSCQHPTTILLLHKENAMHNSAALVEAFMVQMSLLGLLGGIQAQLIRPLTSELLFNVTAFSESLLNMLGGDFSKVVDPELSPAPGYVTPQLHSNPEMEQVTVVTLTGHQLMKTFGLFLGQLLGVVPHSRSLPLQPVQEGFELLGVKWLPCLSIHQAKELTPFEVGQKHWKDSIHRLTSEPAVVLVLRGVNAFRRLTSLLQTRKLPNPALTSSLAPSVEQILAATPELAYRQVRLFFQDRELYTDDTARTLLPYLPPPLSRVAGGDKVTQPRSASRPQGRATARVVTPQTESIIQTMLSEPRPLTTVLVLKPDVVTRHLGKLLKRVTQEGFKVVGLRLEVIDKVKVNDIVSGADKQSGLLAQHLAYLTQRPSIILCLLRENAVKHLLDTLGPEDPRESKRRGSYLWRGVFGTDTIRNGLYGSQSYSSAVYDQKLFFPQGLCCQPTADLQNEQIPCPAVEVRLDQKLSEARCVTHTDSTHVGVTRTDTDRTSGVPRYHLSSLTQTNLVLLTPPLTEPRPRDRKRPYVEIVDPLLSQGFELVGAEMVWMTSSQAETTLKMLQAGSFNLLPVLVSGPCLVLALQRDNAVIIFDSLLGSAFNKDSVHSKYSKQILRPTTVQQADQLLAYFFDTLMPGAHAVIETTESM